MADSELVVCIYSAFICIKHKTINLKLLDKVFQANIIRITHMRGKRAETSIHMHIQKRRMHQKYTNT